MGCFRFTRAGISLSILAAPIDASISVLALDLIYSSFCPPALERDERRKYKPDWKEYPQL